MQVTIAALSFVSSLNPWQGGGTHLNQAPVGRVTCPRILLPSGVQDNRVRANKRQTNQLPVRKLKVIDENDLIAGIPAIAIETGCRRLVSGLEKVRTVTPG
jgi:hypothetical protein